jgi:hydroxymethylglutaryl-CoA reductase (NADPH)
VTDEVITSTLKSDPEKMLEVYEAKLITGSKLAGAIGSNLHAANVIAALYLATGQDAAHVVEGSMCDTTFERMENSVRISVRLPAILVGTIGGGTGLPAQRQCLDLLSKPTTPLSRAQQIAESIGGAVLAGEVSLLAAQAAQKLASSHKKMAR